MVEPDETTERATPSKIMIGSVMVQKSATKGINTLTSAVAISIQKIVTLRPNLSTIEPMTGASSRPGMEVMVIRIPALVAEPVS